MCSAILRTVLLLSVLFFSSLTLAQNDLLPVDSQSAIASLTSQAHSLRLADSRYWHVLLHYHKSTMPFSDAVESNVVSPEFFLASNGRSNPEAELSSTIAAMYEPPLADKDQHPQCRFVARYQWLREQLNWENLPAPPKIQCNMFELWSKNGEITSVSLVFATGYLSNPASLYGHMLVRFDTRDSKRMAGLLDPSMSYGALVPQHENGLVYVFRGLLGGYDAGFSHDQFFQHYHGYAEEELRDLWEYKLKLDKADVDRLVAHCWELLRIKFAYYFLSDNCASEVSELLALVVDDPLLPDLPWAIPSTVLDRINAAEKNGKPLVLTTTRIPSRQNRFYDGYAQLDASQQVIVHTHIEGVPLKEQSAYQQLDQNQRIRTVTTLIHYYEFQAATHADKQSFRKKRQELLTERFRLPADGMPVAASAAKPPHQGNPPLTLQLSAVHNSEFGSGAGIRIRPAYYDALSLEAGRFPFSSLAMLDTQLMYFDDSLFFRKLDLVSIASLNLSQTGLPGDGGYAWALRFGMEQQNLGCDDCRVFETEGGIGEAFALARDFAVFVLLDARVQTVVDNSGSVAAGAHAGIVKNWSDTIALSTSVGHRSYINGGYASYPYTNAEIRFGSSRNWDIRIRYERNIESETSAAVSLYW